MVLCSNFTQIAKIAVMNTPTEQATLSPLLSIRQAGGIALILLMSLVNDFMMTFFWSMMMLVVLNLIALLMSLLLRETAK
ncbi:MAG: hypothetical protein ACFFDJ_02805, partial [Candidatus Odinarchaeota archaeon]